MRFTRAPETRPVGRLAWESVLPLSGRETDHVVYRGSLGDFPVGSSSSCTATTVKDWFLVRGSNSCGEGSLGAGEGGAQRGTPSCF